MVRTNYARGSDKERRIKRRLEKDGWLCIRSAGSKSAVDLVAINRKLKLIRFIQVKPKGFSNKKTEELCKELSWLNDEYYCTFEVIGTISIHLGEEDENKTR